MPEKHQVPENTDDKTSPDVPSASKKRRISDTEPTLPVDQYITQHENYEMMKTSGNGVFLSWLASIVEEAEYYGIDPKYKNVNAALQICNESGSLVATLAACHETKKYSTILSQIQTTTSPLDHAIEKAQQILKGMSDLLRVVTTQDPRPDQFESFFVDGLGDLHRSDPDVRRRVSNLFEPGTPKVIYNTSGSGKTRLLVEGLSHRWGFYLTPDGPCPRLGARDLSSSLIDLETYASEGSKFVTELPDSPRSRQKCLEKNRNAARTLFRKVILGRLLILQAFLDAGANINVDDLRRRWVYLQLKPSSLSQSTTPDIFYSIYQTIKYAKGDDKHHINALLDNLQNDSRISGDSFFVALDEAQVCANMYETSFYSENGSCEPRSVLREVFKAWSHFPQFTVLLSGTGFSITKIEKTLASSLGIKAEIATFIDVGAFIKEEDQRNYITRHVTLEEDTKEEVLCRAWRWLRGRYRFTAGYVHALKQCRTTNALGVLNQYIKTLSEYTPTDCNDTLTPDEEDRFLKCRLKSVVDYVRCLDNNCSIRRQVAVAINSFISKHKPYLFSPEHIQTIECGIARYTTSSSSSNILLDEPLIVAGLLTYFKQSTFSLDQELRLAICEIPEPATRGYDLEEIGAYILAQEFNGTKKLDEIFDIQTHSPEIQREEKAQLIAIRGIKEDGSVSYDIIKDPILNPFGFGFKAKDACEYQAWLEGNGIPICFPDERAGPDATFFALVGESIVLVTVQFKSYKDYLTATATRRALKTLCPSNWYKDKNGRTYKHDVKQSILTTMSHYEVPTLGVLASFPSNPHSSTIDKEAPEHFALFDVAKVDNNIGQTLAGFKADQFPHLDCRQRTKE